MGQTVVFIESQDVLDVLWDNIQDVAKLAGLEYEPHREEEDLDILHIPEDEFIKINLVPDGQTKLPLNP